MIVIGLQILHSCHVREFLIGKQGVAFDRHELDAWADA